MLPFSPIEEITPDLSNFPDLDILFGELLEGIGTPAADASHNLTALASPIPGPDGIPLIPSPFHPPEDQPNARNSVPARIQNFSRQMAQNPATLCSIEREVHNLQAEQPTGDGHSEKSSLADMLQLERPDSPLPELRPIPDFLENSDPSEKENVRQGQAAIPQISAIQEVSSSPHILSNSRLPRQEILLNNFREVFTPVARDVTNSPVPVRQGIVRNQDKLHGSLTNMTTRSKFFHIRPPNRESERPAKRQRKAKRMISIGTIPASSQLFSAPSTQVDKVLIQKCLTKGSDSQLFTMPVVNDTAIQRNVMANDIRYQWKNITGDSAPKNGASAVENESPAHQGVEAVCGCLPQPDQCSAEIFETPGNKGSHQTPRNYAASIKASNILMSGPPPYSSLPAEGTARPSYAVGTRKLIQALSLNQVENIAADDRMPSAASHPPQPDPKTVTKSIARTNLLETPLVTAHRIAMNCPTPLEVSPDCGRFDAAASAPSLSEISGNQVHEVPGNTSDSEDLQNPRGQAIETPEDVSDDLDRTGTGSGAFYSTIRLENPPKCNICKKLYITEEDLRKHEKAAHVEDKSGTFTCPECKGTFKNDTNLRRHMYHSHQNRKFYCNSCGAGFSKQRALVIHEKKRHRKVPTSVQRKKAVRQPLSSANEKEVLFYYECLLCTYSTTVKGNLLRHVKGKHLNERPFQCPHCDKRGKTKQNIDFHIPVCRKRPQDTGEAQGTSEES